MAAPTDTIIIVNNKIRQDTFREFYADLVNATFMVHHFKKKDMAAALNLAKENPGCYVLGTVDLDIEGFAQHGCRILIWSKHVITGKVDAQRLLDRGAWYVEERDINRYDRLFDKLRFARDPNYESTSSEQDAPARSALRCTPAAPRIVEVWLVRHGERIDETPLGRKWQVKNGHWLHDPPLTDTGFEQSKRAGERVFALAGQEMFPVVYSSPLMRCVGTAAALSEVCVSRGMVLVPGLAECAAAVKRHGLARTRFRDDVHIAEAFPKATVISRDDQHDAFQAALERLCLESRKARILVATHREGIRDMVQLTGAARPKTPYACVTGLSFDTHSGEWTLLWKPRDPCDDKLWQA